ncbi:glycosyltransferase family 2 protein [Cyclobacterium jeungdonense]|uniref:Glycosyltransferase family 2 protein n=1 Tax=Cyclobacterium jeungdonense TaxID=708087 RepID=A0ABT8C239_9BACT|nr:glycosyltransferase family 2 protein [Cyclobacterium jeungdonense]MDN3686555.1 glycosyltransferase family 2 protein [Cyclobacterium jeungdonense]
MNEPTLSVIMPVYNGERYLQEAIDSVLKQNFTDFELIAIDDGSTDGSNEILKGQSDPRIRVLSNGINKGISFTRNRGLDEAKGEFLAWMDCDDLIAPDRFKKQLAFFKTHPQVGICGTWLTRFDERKSEVSKSPLEHEAIKAMLLFKPAIWNATAMYRLNWIKEANLSFDPRLAVAEDFDFYWEACRKLPVANLPESLYYYRDSDSSIMKRFDGAEERSFSIHKIIYEKSLRELGITPTEDQLRIHRSIGSTYLFQTYRSYKEAFEWLVYLQEKNKIQKIYDSDALSEILGSIFFFLSKKSSQVGLPVFFYYLKELKKFYPADLYQTTKLLIRCLIKYRRF